MNKIFIAIMPWLFAAIGYKATAQETPKVAPPPPANEQQEIIIRKKGEKDVTVTVEFKDDKVLINGKPMIEFKDDAVTINNRTFKFRDFERDFEKEMAGFERHMEGMGRDIELAFSENGVGKMKGGTFLGVTTTKDEKGAKIEEVVKGSAAEKAGLKKDDIITKVDDTKVLGPSELSEIITEMKPNKEVKVYYIREGKNKTVKATLQERSTSEIRTITITTPEGQSKTITVPGVPLAPRAPRAPRTPGTAMPPMGYDWNMDEYKMEGNYYARPKLGLKIQDVEEGNAVKVLDVEAGSVAEKAGLKKDDMITSIGDITVTNTDEARKQLQLNSDKSEYRIGAKRNNTNMRFDIKIPKKLKTANL